LHKGEKKLYPYYFATEFTINSRKVCLTPGEEEFEIENLTIKLKLKVVKKIS
jgi:hypothetical protein